MDRQQSSKTSRDAVILSAARTPIGKFMGALASLPATELGAHAVKAALEQSGVEPGTVYEVIMGHVVAAGSGQAPGRQATLKAGLPDTIGAATVNKVCGSGLKAVMMAANGIAAREAEVYIAGGMESLSQAPYVLPKARQGLRYGDAALKDSILLDGLWCSFQDWVMGSAAEFIARQFEVTRAEMDEFSLQSHERAAKATAAGRFRHEIVPVEIPQRRSNAVRVERDEGIRASFDNGDYTLQTNLDILANLPPAFEEDGQVTAGNAPGLNDAGAAMVISSRAEAERQGATPMARVVGYTHAAVDPKWIFAAPARAIPNLLEKIGWDIQDVDLFEINEAFSSQILANGVELQRRGLPLDWEKVNVHGGAIALGHPLGATGARVLVTLLHALKQYDLKRGVASLCLGGGEAVALAVEME